MEVKLNGVRNDFEGVIYNQRQRQNILILHAEMDMATESENKTEECKTEH